MQNLNRQIVSPYNAEPIDKIPGISLFDYKTNGLGPGHISKTDTESLYVNDMAFYINRFYTNILNSCDKWDHFNTIRKNK